jgi:hypothetical protein
VALFDHMVRNLRKHTKLCGLIEWEEIVLEQKGDVTVIAPDAGPLRVFMNGQPVHRGGSVGLHRPDGLLSGSSAGFKPLREAAG